jgi:hypothetical protein
VNRIRVDDGESKIELECGVVKLPSGAVLKVYPDDPELLARIVSAKSKRDKHAAQDVFLRTGVPTPRRRSA